MKFSYFGSNTWTIRGLWEAFASERDEAFSNLTTSLTPLYKHVLLSFLAKHTTAEAFIVVVSGVSLKCLYLYIIYCVCMF